jgi:hypothetical protein
VTVSQKQRSIGEAQVWPNPSLKAPTHYGGQRKAGLWPSGIITVQPYAAHLRGRL